MIPVLRKVAQFNVKYRKKNRSPVIDAWTGAPPDQVTALIALLLFVKQKLKSDFYFKRTLHLPYG